MAGGSSILKEFLVKIGFQVDETKFRRFQEVMRTTANNAVEMAKVVTAATVGAGAVLVVAGKQLEGVYFAAKRTGAGASELKSLAFAAQQIGLSAEQATSALEGMATARRTNPGLNGILGQLGINPAETDNAKILIELLGKLRSMPYYQGAQIAQMFGINEQTFQMMEQGLPEMQKWLALREKMFGAAGISGEQMAGRSHEFMDHFRTLEAVVGNLADIIAYRLMPAGEKVIDWITDVVTWFTKADKATGGWSSKILGLAIAFKGTASGLGLLGKLLGRGAATTALGEGAGGVAGVGAGILGIVDFPLIIGLVVAAVAAYFVFSKDGPKQLIHAAEKLKDTIVKSDFGQKVIKATEATKDSVVSAWKNSGIGDSLTAMVARFEGHATNGYGVYRDIAGHLTAGFGHLVRPGEDFSNLDKQGAVALLGRDLANAASVVAQYVKVALTKNQRDALTDFEFPEEVCELDSAAHVERGRLCRRRRSVPVLESCTDQRSLGNRRRSDGAECRGRGPVPLGRSPHSGDAEQRVSHRLDGPAGGRS